MTQYHVTIWCNDQCRDSTRTPPLRSLDKAKELAVWFTNHLNVETAVWRHVPRTERTSSLEAHYKPNRRWLTTEDAE